LTFFEVCPGVPTAKKDAIQTKRYPEILTVPGVEVWRKEGHEL
jgi:hypothetical protein